MKNGMIVFAILIIACVAVALTLLLASIAPDGLTFFGGLAFIWVMSGGAMYCILGDVEISSKKR